jgi:long-chain acyl-CoA synthetase
MDHSDVTGKTDYDWLVVGSGFGGSSVSALRLAEKGYRVGVLEAGRRFEDADFADNVGQAQKTAETINADGWVHTGDIGAIDADGYGRVVDHKNELIINAAGKNMPPASIEGAIRAFCPVVALLTLDPDSVAQSAASNGFPAAPRRRRSPPMRRCRGACRRVAATLSRVEQIKKFLVLPDVWEPGAELLTPTLKLKRKPIAQRYADRIDQLYGQT